MSRSSAKARQITLPAAEAILGTALWFAFFTGLADVVLLTVASQVLHRFVYYYGIYLVWMAPLANIALFSIPALVLYVTSRRFPRAGELPVPVGVFSFLSFLDLLWLVTELHPIAAFVLSMGLALQMARLAARYPALFVRVLRVTMGWLDIPRWKRHIEVAPSSKVEATPEVPSAVEAAPPSAPEPPPQTLVTRRQFLLTAGATMAGLAVGVAGWNRLTESRHLAALPLPSKKLPNVLLIVLDTTRALNLSLYGYARRTTPELERLAQQSVVFDRAVSAASWTLPSHASMFTGRMVNELSVDYQAALDTHYPTLAEFLSGQGYETAGFVSNLYYTSRESGLARGFTHYRDFVASPGRVLTASSLVRTLSTEEIRRTIGSYQDLGRRSAEDISADFLGWLGNRDERRPFFTFLNFYDAHEPYLPPAPYDTLFGPRQPRHNPFHGADYSWSPSEVQAEMDAYDGAIAYLDNQLGRLFADLEQRGILDDTLVILTGDHGEEFQEHGIMDHGFSLYLPVIHVPLLARFPARLPAGMRVTTSVSLRDLTATILDVIGTEAASIFPGRSLARYWSKDGGTDLVLSEVRFLPGYPQYYPVSRGDVKSLMLDPYHYIHSADGHEELYDSYADPWEKTDLSQTEQGKVLISRFRNSLEQFAVRQNRA